MKKCFKCLCVKPLSEFYAHKAMKDGHLNKCKACTKADVATHRVQNLNAIKAYDKARANLPHRVEFRKAYAKSDRGRAAHARALSKYKAEHAERHRARTALGNAVRCKRIQRWPCEVCGNEKSQGHHPDYSRPLLVTWLCSTHHAQAHRETNDAIRRAA